MKAKRAKKEKIKIKPIKLKLNAKQKKIAVIIAAVLVLCGIIYGKTIFKLQLENKELKKEQAELKEEKKKLTKELKNIHSKEYIKDQARKQLRLLDKDEILFVFEEDEDE